MKKVLSTLVILVLLATGLAGCSDSFQPEGPTPATEPSAAQEPSPLPSGEAAGSMLPNQPDAANLAPIDLTFSTMAVGSPTNVMTSNMVSVMLKYLPEGSNINVATDLAGTAVSPFMLSEGLCDIVIGDSTPTVWALQGITPGREGVVAQDVCAIGGGMFFSSIDVIFAAGFREKSGYDTIEEMVENRYPVRFATKVTGSFGAMSMDMVFEALGITEDDIKSWGGSVTRIDATQAIDMIKDGRADVYIDHNNRFNAGLTELAMTSDIYFAQLAQSTLDTLGELGYAEAVIERESFSGKPDRDIMTGASGQCFLIHADVPDEYAYLLTMAICESIDELVALNANFESFDPSVAWMENGTGAPLHPGSLLYYTDKGYC